LTAERPWYDDPAEVDLLLDGEAPPEILCLHQAEAAADPAIEARVEARRALHRAIGRARDAVSPGMPDLELRVRAALAADRRRATKVPIPLWAYGLAAAVRLAGVAAARFLAEPAPGLLPPKAEAVCAADLLRSTARTDDGAPCGGEAPTSPYRFPLVERREMRVRACVDSGTCALAERALLARPGDAGLVAYVAVPETGAVSGPEIGVTRLRDAVVFDVRRAGVAYYLAVRRDLVDRRGACAACHQSLGRDASSPHRLRERQAID
jgi:hypothetical protein